jgi:hypothetical protein
MTHVSGYHLGPVQRHHAKKFTPSRLVRGDLRLEIGDVLVRRSAGPLATGQQGTSFGFAQVTFGDEGKRSMTTPSSSIRVLSGGPEPGVRPPISA